MTRPLEHPKRSGMRVLHVAQTAQGGVGSYLEEIVPQQARLYGHQALRAVLPAQHISVFPALQGPWLATFETDGSRLKTSARMAGLSMHLVRNWRPDVVHLHSTYAGLVLRPLLKALPWRPRIVYCAHGWAFDRETGSTERAAIRQVERVLASWCDAVVCVSEFEARQARDIGIKAHRLVLVPNGVSDLAAPRDSGEASRWWPPGVLRVLFVGRMDRQKGVDTLYDALRRLGGNAHAVVVGSAVVGDQGITDPPPNVGLLGWKSRSDIARLYAAADVLVVPSRWEAFGLVAIEAMRAGLPVVASRVGGLPEVVEDGATGLLVPPEDGQALAQALSSLRPEQMRTMGHAGRERFLRLFKADRVVAQLDAIYRGDFPPASGAWPAHTAMGDPT